MSYITTFNISIHALREEGDMYSIPGLVDHHYFYPRPPRGGRRFGFLILILLFSISIHALREEGDEGQRGIHGQKDISIHALREEGDSFGFLILILLFSISIHALREEGDVTIPLSGSAPLDFYPRPPRGGRRGF